MPEPGAWANERQDEMPNEHNYGEHEALSTNPRRNQRVTKPTKSSCNIMHAALLENITEAELTEHHAYLKDRLAAHQRRAVPLVQGSHGQRNRTTGVADCLHRPKHAVKDASRKRKNREIDAVFEPVYQHVEEECEEARVKKLQDKISVEGVIDGHFVEVFPVKGSKERWFMQILNGRVLGPSNDLYLQSSIWCKSNTLETEKPIRTGKCCIRSIKNSGSAHCFERLDSKSKSGQTSTAQPAQPLKILALASVVAPIPWLTEKVAVKFVQGANKDTVISVTLQEMMQQMLQRGVKGVDKCSCKEDLTALMRAEKFVFDSKLFKSVPAISDRLLDSAAPATAPGSGSILWHEVLVGWKNTLGRVVAN